MKRVHIGNSPANFHSLRDFRRLDDALAYMWAMANTPQSAPQKCWLWQGLDGWLTNSHMTGKPYPATLAKRIEEFIEEDIQATREA